MEWEYPLRSQTKYSEDALSQLLPNFAPTTEPWRVSFWFGGWDADASSFYTWGVVEIDPSGSTISSNSILERPERSTDIERM